MSSRLLAITDISGCKLYGHCDIDVVAAVDCFKVLVHNLPCFLYLMNALDVF